MASTLSPTTSDFSTLKEDNVDLEKQDIDNTETSGSNHSNFMQRLKNIVSPVVFLRLPRFWSNEEKEILPLATVRPLTVFSDGYPNLAAFQDSSENFMIYRRFGYLQARVLLEKQDKLRILEGDLDDFDQKNDGCAVSRQPNQKNAKIIEARSDLLDQIDIQLTGYTQSLANAQQLMGFNKPSGTEQGSVSAYLANHKPVKAAEREYVNHKEDLVTLRPGREHAWLDRSIEAILRGAQNSKYLSFVHKMFCSEETRQKNGDGEVFGDVYYYTRSRIDGLAIGLITAAILALLIVPIWLLYHIVNGNDGLLTARGNAICIGILLIATLLFSAVLSLFTRARRHEILAAAAAYCAVLVVFLGNVRPT